MEGENKKYKYDVVFSLAGEQRGFAIELKEYLENEDLTCWLYTDKEHELVGKDQPSYFKDLFVNDAKYCVILISKNYAKKVWPNLERKYITSRWMDDPNYLIPIQFDKTELSDIPSTIGYIPLNNRSPSVIAEIILKKIKNGQKTPNGAAKFPKSASRIPNVKQDFDPYEIKREWIQDLPLHLKEMAKEVPEMKVHSDDVGDMVAIRVRFKNNTVYSLNILKKSSFSRDTGISFHGSIGESTTSSGSSNAWGNFEWCKEKNNVVLTLHDLSLFDTLSSEEEKYTKEEFIDALWNRICNEIEVQY